ncbi:hypothetical protein [Bacillus sp. CECT 9360]|uniref:hypothetical protein n=1 Tax=Bacillus sp. CECT 9360 TaxID=2845821 RepID=UPI001E3BB302|nr:hypothetical protein [Bacillus sp. CECT 9360]CAH0344224.1 hypothetical protein BCI9360_00466 [Bacillus sp. CECT 9360]
MLKKQTSSKIEKTEDKPAKALNDLDPEMSLQSVTFATTENLYLNQQDNDES